MKYLILALLFGCSVKEKSEDSSEFPKMSMKGNYPVIEVSSELKYHTGLLVRKAMGLKEERKEFAVLDDCENLPDSFDLREMGLVSSVKDQGQCGSCWSFANTSAFESALLGAGKMLDLSEQERVSNDKTQYGCEGGFMGFNYEVKHGQGLEKDFPYTSGRTGQNGKAKEIPVAAKAVSWKYIGGENKAPSDKELKCALVTYKSVLPVTVGATNAWSSPPKSEKTAYANCGRSQTNHMVGIVGYWTDSKGKTQYLMKNSWGTSWGDKGYMSLPAGCNNFAEEAAVVMVDKPTPPEPTPTPPAPTPTPTPPAPTPTPGPKTECDKFYETLGMCLGAKTLKAVPANCYEAAGKMFSCLEAKYK